MRAPPVELHSGDMRIGDDRQIGAFASRCEIRLGGTHAQAIARRELVVSNSFLRAAIEISGTWNAEVLAGRDHRFNQLVRTADAADADGALAAVQLVFSWSGLFSSLTK